MESLCLYLQTDEHTFVWTCVSCVAHVAEPQGVGELLASNWNCRFNILNYRLANGQYFVTTLPAPPPLPYCLSTPFAHCSAWSCHRPLHAHIKLCHINCIAINNQLLCVCFQLSILTSSSFSLLQLGRGNFSRECDCLVFDCLQKLFIVLPLLLLLLLIVLEIVIYSYMWDSLYGSNCLEVSTTETLRGFRCVQSKSQGHLWRVLNGDDANLRIAQRNSWKEFIISLLTSWQEMLFLNWMYLALQLL